MSNGKSSPLTDILPAKVRKYVYATYAFIGVVVAVWSVVGEVPDVVTNVLYAIGVALGAVAASNVRHTPPAL